MLENGGDVVTNIWWVWTFSALGARYSVDALKKSLATGADPSPPPPNAVPNLYLRALWRSSWSSGNSQ